MRLEGKVALVTGAGRGMGKAIALLFAKEGADIAVNDINPETAKTTAEAVKKIGRKAIAIRADVANANEVDAMVDRVIKELGGVNILVNNAGITSGGPTIDTKPESWERIMKVNLGGMLNCSRKAGRWMLNNGGGRIVNIASVAGIMAFPGTTSYSSSKAGVISMTRVLAVEWAKNNIRVNSIAPSFVRTPMQEEGLKEGGPTIEDIEKKVPMGRIGEPEEIAKAALFLVSDDASFITGATLLVDGGFLAYEHQTM